MKNEIIKKSILGINVHLDLDKWFLGIMQYQKNLKLYNIQGNALNNSKKYIKRAEEIFKSKKNEFKIFSGATDGKNWQLELINKDGYLIQANCHQILENLPEYNERIIVSKDGVYREIWILKDHNNNIYMKFREKNNATPYLVNDQYYIEKGYNEDDDISLWEDEDEEVDENNTYCECPSCEGKCWEDGMCEDCIDGAVGYCTWCFECKDSHKEGIPKECPNYEE